MWKYVCICIYTHTHTYLSIYIYTCACIQIHVHIHTHKYMCTCVIHYACHVFTYIVQMCMCVCHMRAYTYMYCVCVCVCVWSVGVCVCVCKTVLIPWRTNACLSPLHWCMEINRSIPCCLESFVPECVLFWDLTESSQTGWFPVWAARKTSELLQLKIALGLTAWALTEPGKVLELTGGEHTTINTVLMEWLMTSPFLGDGSESLWSASPLILQDSVI